MRESISSGAASGQKVYIASADYMTRNTCAAWRSLRRFTIDLRAHILDMFDTMPRDNVQAREMESNGQYHRLKPARMKHRSAVRNTSFVGRMTLRLKAGTARFMLILFFNNVGQNCG